MAKGYPDFFGQSIFLNYGKMEIDAGDETLTGIDVVNVNDIDFKGVLVGGLIWLRMGTALDMALQEFTLIADSTTLFQLPFGSQNLGRYTIGAHRITKTLEYLARDGEVAVELTMQMTIENNLTLVFDNKEAGKTAQVNTWIFYQSVL